MHLFKRLAQIQRALQSSSFPLNVRQAQLRVLKILNIIEFPVNDKNLQDIFRPLANSLNE